MSNVMILNRGEFQMNQSIVALVFLIEVVDLRLHYGSKVIFTLSLDW